MRPLRGLIICEDAALRERIAELLTETGQVEQSLVLSHYPGQAEAGRQLRIARPDVVLVVIERLNAVIEFLREMEFTCPTAAVVGISRLQDPRALTELMRIGVRDHIAAPINRQRFQDAIQRVVYQFSEAAHRVLTEPLVSFVPVRGGSGTSTLACNISHAMAARPGSRVLLADLDVSAGLSRFLFRMTPSCSLGELLASGQTIDRHTLSRCIVTAGNLHVVCGGPANPRQPFTAYQMRSLLELIGSGYSALCIDLTGSMETYALELMRRSRRILLVCTSEVPSIELAREKLRFLETLDLRSRASILLTLCPESGQANHQQLQKYLGVPVQATFDFGERRVRQSLSEGSLIEPKTTLGRQIAQFASELSSQLAAGASQPC